MFGVRSSRWINLRVTARGGNVGVNSAGEIEKNRWNSGW